METWRSFQKAEHEGEPVRRFVPCYPAAIRRDNDRHDRKAGAAGADEIVRGILVKTSTVPREPAERMRTLPKILEGLVLDEIDQRRVRQVRAGLDAFRLSAWGWHWWRIPAVERSNRGGLLFCWLYRNRGPCAGRQALTLRVLDQVEDTREKAFPRVRLTDIDDCRVR